MSEPLVQGTTDVKALAQELRELADRMERNSDGSFGGAYVVIPPAGGDVIKMLILDSAKDPAQFWAVLKTRCEMVLAGLDEIQRNVRAYR